MPGQVKVIDLTEEEQESVETIQDVPCAPPKKIRPGSYEDYLARAAASREAHRGFWDRIRRYTLISSSLIP